MHLIFKKVFWVTGKVWKHGAEYGTKCYPKR